MNTENSGDIREEAAQNFSVDPGKNIAADDHQEEEENYIVGPGHPPKHSRFSKDKQPDPNKQKYTKAKKRFSREILKEMLNMKYAFTPDSQIKKQLLAAFGDKILKMTVSEVMCLQQMQKAILKGDTNAVALLLNQSLGMPKQELGFTDANGNDIITQVGYGKKDLNV